MKTRSAQDGKAFRSHGRVLRQFRVIVGNVVHRFTAFLRCWYCPGCVCYFRHRPPDVAPRKLYLPLESVLPHCERYLHEEPESYRQAALTPPPCRMAVVHNDQHTRALAHSTLWRWMVYLADGWKNSWVRRMLERAQVKAVDLNVWRIAHGKSRSAKRRAVLLRASQALCALQFVRKSIENGTLTSGP